MNSKELLEIAIKASIEAGVEILKVYDRDDHGVESKKDDSPLTLADIASNNVINSYLQKTNVPIISEENKETVYAERKAWKDCWIVDPLDGTKEFIKKNGEFTVNIALVSEGEPILGVIYVPVSRELYYADAGLKASFKTVLTQDHEVVSELFKEDDKINPSIQLKDTIRVVGSRSHMNEDTESFVAGLKSKYKNVEIVSKGSSLKFCLVAEGIADVYPRFAPTMEWDTAAGQAICNAVGLKVTAQDSQKPLLYNKENLLNPYFLISN
ncbi:3'(2'),5'-bisphosphate nucleotidase CysQ [Flagellimonas eckloniae]|uniref:3'(2'),5'-bisphosphate nucleotidase CysQ n=1 Tax=Flagellimonas eckloniae TaxID=346185 RepID=A0A0Q0XL34_9FLAO|nr:3'(2'),5'-bisphosphate nucleotidase CysQ [Allomuricauda eckloniae]KQC31613.1 3'-5'-bisphosphate nucleotidase [Allomuricauda eckloniae]